MAATRNRVRLKRYIEAYAHDPRLAWSKQLAQQINLTVKSLVETIGEASAGALLRVIDGTRTPRRKLKAKPFLAVSGNVEVSQTLEEVRLHFPVPDGGGLDSATGLDGVDASLVADALTVRASRDAISTSISTTQNPLNPTGWNTADHLLLTLTANSTIQSLGTLDASGTRLKRITNVSTGSFTATFQHSTTLRCPAFVNFSLSPGSSVWVYNENGTTEWRVLSVYVQPGITDHGLLTGLDDPSDHPWAILVDGTRPFTGDQSMGDNDLTNWNRLIATDALSTINLSGGDLLNTSIIDMVGDAWLDMNGSDILAVDDITAAGSGSIWNMSGGSLTNPALVQMQNSSSVIDANEGTVQDAGWMSLVDDVLGSAAIPAITRLALGSKTGIPHWRAGRDILWAYPAHTYYNESHSLASSPADITIDFSDIDGKNLTDGAFILLSACFICDNEAGSRSYVELRLHNVELNSGADTGGAIDERLFDNGSGIGAFVMQDSRGPALTFSLSGQVVTITQSNVFGGGTAKRWSWVLIWGMGG